MVLINLNMPCNQDCLFCQRSSFLENNPQEEPLPSEEVKKQIIESKDSNVIFSGGGEPTLREDLCDLMKFAKNQGKEEIMLETNGVKLEKEGYVKNLKNAGMNHCVVSLHSHKEEISDKITCAPGTFIKTIKGLENLKKENIRISIIYTLCSLNYKDNIDFVKFVTDNFGKDISFTMGFVWPKENNEIYASITPQFSEVKPYLGDIINFLEESNIAFDMSMNCNFPLCFIPPRLIPKLIEVRSFFNEGKERFDSITYANEKMKPKQCKSCSLNSICTGIFKTYYEMYGGKELSPMSLPLEEIKKKIIGEKVV